MTTYRQIAHRLRWTRETEAGRQRIESERPRARNGAFMDTDAPTLVTFDEFDRVDLPALLGQGAIVELPPEPKPKRKAAPVSEEVPGGENLGT